MDFNPDCWASHRRGEAARREILRSLDQPRTIEDIAGRINKSVRQVQRHIQSLSIEGKTMRCPDGRIMARSITIAGLLLLSFLLIEHGQRVTDNRNLTSWHRVG